MDVLSRKPPVADRRIAYGPGPNQFGDLWLPQPSENKLLPLVVFFHGGWWLSQFDLSYGGHLCAALKREGIACWSVEYSRVGQPGGGWPGTFRDAANGFDFVAQLAKQYPLDTARVIAMGHSAGGHLAFWIAGRHHIDAQSEIYEPRPKVPLHGVIALAGAVDLRLLISFSSFTIFERDPEYVQAMMGGRPKDVPKRFAAGNPGELLPFNIPQVLIQGIEDDQIPPELPGAWADKAHRSYDTVTVKKLMNCDHFDVVDPQSGAWPTVRDAVKAFAFR